MLRCFFFDIDGTLSDPSHRLHHIQKTPKDWAAFFAAVGDDAPIEHMIRLVRICQLSDPVVFLSGRSDECRGQTTAWLHNQHVAIKSPNRIFMRRAGDYRPDEVVKPELLAAARSMGYEPLMIFDDRRKVVEAWRALGIPCAQVADGDF